MHSRGIIRIIRGKESALIVCDFWICNKMEVRCTPLCRASYTVAIHLLHFTSQTKQAYDERNDPINDEQFYQIASRTDEFKTCNEALEYARRFLHLSISFEDLERNESFECDGIDDPLRVSEIGHNRFSCISADRRVKFAQAKRERVLKRGLDPCPPLGATAKEVRSDSDESSDTAGSIDLGKNEEAFQKAKRERK